MSSSVAPKLASKSKRKKTSHTVDIPCPALPAEAVMSLRAFVYWALGDGHLSSWEENLLNSVKLLLFDDTVWLSQKRLAKVQEIKDKLHYDRPDVPLAALDPDGIEPNDDPDGWPAKREWRDPYEDEELEQFR